MMPAMFDSVRRLFLVVLLCSSAACATGDGDQLATLMCAPDQVPRWNGTDWVCSGSDVLGQLSCAMGAVPKWDGNAWVCGVDDSTALSATYPVTIDGSNNISIADQGITTAHIMNATILNEDISFSANIDPLKISGTAATLTGDQVFENNALVIDTANSRVGVGVNPPVTSLDVSGDISTTGDYRLSPARMRTKFYSPASFRVAYPSSTSYDPVSIASTGNYAYISTGSASYYNYMLADIQLPDGAVIDSMTCYFYDNSTTVDITSDAYIYRRAYTATSGSNQLNIPLETSGESSTTMRSNTASPASPLVIDNTGNSYFLRVYWYTGANASSLARFYGCALNYSVDRL